MNAVATKTSRSPLYGEGWKWNHKHEPHPYFYTIQFDGFEECRPMTNHKPNCYARLATVKAHLEQRRKAMAMHGECAMTVRIYENGYLLDTHILPSKQP